ncbi:MAG TPA: phosphoribosylanthranilate isomerase [Atribacteraceae bacterium]|nr:phosphoribosylanthranilate isomerase [Atribacteraceae bacterium]
MPLLKICGITREEDARWCESSGVWALGFILVSGSPRYCPPEKAAGIIRQLRGKALAVGVFQDETAANVNDITRRCGFDLVQLHGEEAPEECRAVEVPVIKAFSVDEGWVPASLASYIGSIAMVLLDARRGTQRGGTGWPFPWEVLPLLADLSLPLIIAGGLGEENIPDLLSRCSPWAIDCNSRVETAPGCKDRRTIRRILNRLSQYRKEVNSAHLTHQTLKERT